MIFLTIDIGAGTQDIMLYDSYEPIENATKLVLPSPTKIFARKIRNHHHNIFLSGETMGGGAVNRAISSHLSKGYKVTMTENAARTVRDDLQKVKSMGIEIVPNMQKHPEMAEIKLGDVDLNLLRETLQKYDVDLRFDYLGVAVQDHGYKEGWGDRNFRIKTIKDKLKQSRKIEDFGYYKEVPDYLTRMRGITRSLKEYKPTLMDSKFAALAGALCDPKVQEMDNFIALDVGNGHTLAASFKKGKVCGIFEHHTRMLNTKKIRIFLDRLRRGDLSNDEIYSDGGHGAHIIEPLDSFESLVATGPQRKLLHGSDLPVYNAVPAGDVMMAGPVGLIKAISYRTGIKA
jgi:uncharacterized protein (DUF1786 family)